MVYEKQFSLLNSDVKKQMLKNFVLCAFVEFCCNLYLRQYCLSLTFMPFLWLVFTQKYFPFNSGCLLFTIGFLYYFHPYPFSTPRLCTVAILLFILTRKINHHRPIMVSALLLQSIFFVLLDPVFNRTTLLQSIALTLLSFYLLPGALLFQKKKRKETSFIALKNRNS
ncbi:MAG: hypothetical protein LBN94_01925 [Puniceicoccales bacterium]|jgi:hypothetical protein|nr:hypothetical protein [Puniceicoccales bacterium]